LLFKAFALAWWVGPSIASVFMSIMVWMPTVLISQVVVVRANSEVVRAKFSRGMLHSYVQKYVINLTKDRQSV
jgi:hypothetical protein